MLAWLSVMYLLRGAIWEAGLTRNAPGKARSAARQPAARMLPVRGSVGGRKESFSRWWTHAMLPPRGAHTGVDRNARARNLTYTHRHPFDAATRARRVTPLRARSRAPWRVGAVAVESSTLGEQHPLAVARHARLARRPTAQTAQWFSFRRSRHLKVQARWARQRPRGALARRLTLPG